MAGTLKLQEVAVFKRSCLSSSRAAVQKLPRTCQKAVFIRLKESPVERNLSKKFDGEVMQSENKQASLCCDKILYETLLNFFLLPVIYFNS